MNKEIKSFKTYDEQLDILKKKGLICDNNSLEILKRNNYYFLINRYKDCFIKKGVKPNEFIKGTHFNEIVALYHFDRDLRSLVLKYIINLENTLKSIISYEFSKVYGYGYLDRANFTYDVGSTNEVILEKRISNLFNSIKSTIAQGKRQNRYIKYYSKNYSKIPLWVVINDLSLGLTIKFYKLLNSNLKETIALKLNVTSQDLESFLDILSFFRNLAAHNQRLFDERCNYKINKTYIHEKLKIDDSDNLMALMITFKILLLDNEFRVLHQEINNLLTKLDKDVDTVTNIPVINKMGFEKFDELLNI